jgi:hypothetical protein
VDGGLKEGEIELPEEAVVLNGDYSPPPIFRSSIRYTW